MINSCESSGEAEDGGGSVARVLAYEYNSASRRERRWKRISRKLDAIVKGTRAQYLNWKCVRIETRRDEGTGYTALVALLTSHIAEDSIGTGRSFNFQRRERERRSLDSRLL